jgi:curved DNA-binding protein CbpA
VAAKENPGDYFRGCKNKEETAKRYRLLSRAYHPDSGCGDETLFLELTAQYEEKMKEYR